MDVFAKCSFRLSLNRNNEEDNLENTLLDCSAFGKTKSKATKERFEKMGEEIQKTNC